MEIIEVVEGVANWRETVLQTKCTLKEKLTGGPDGILLRVIKELESKIVEPLMIFF